MQVYLFSLLCLVAAFKGKPGQTELRSEGLANKIEPAKSLSEMAKPAKSLNISSHVPLKEKEDLSSTSVKPKKTVFRKPKKGSKLGSKKKMSRKARKMKYRTPEQLELARKRAVIRLQNYLRRVRARQFRAQMQRNLNLTKLRKIRQIQARLESDKRKLQANLGKTRSAINKDQRLYMSLAKQINLLTRVKTANVKAARKSLRRAASSATRRKFMSRDLKIVNRGSLLIKNSRMAAVEKSPGIGSPRTSAPKVHKPKPMPTKTMPHSSMPSTRADL